MRCGSEIHCAKVYKDMAQRSFQRRSQYQEGRKVRGSRQARAMARSTSYMLERDVKGITDTLGRFAPELLATQYAPEMWALFEQGELKPDTRLTGIFVKDETAPDVGGGLVAIDDAREEAIRRQLGREEAARNIP